MEQEEQLTQYNIDTDLYLIDYYIYRKLSPALNDTIDSVYDRKKLFWEALKELRANDLINKLTKKTLKNLTESAIKGNSGLDFVQSAQKTVKDYYKTIQTDEYYKVKELIAQITCKCARRYKFEHNDELLLDDSWKQGRELICIATKKYVDKGEAKQKLITVDRAGKVFKIDTILQFLPKNTGQPLTLADLFQVITTSHPYTTLNLNSWGIEIENTDTIIPDIEYSTPIRDWSFIKLNEWREYLEKQLS